MRQKLSDFCEKLAISASYIGSKRAIRYGNKSWQWRLTIKQERFWDKVSIRILELQNLDLTKRGKMGEKYFVWVDYSGKAVTPAWPYNNGEELAAELEQPPRGGHHLLSGSKKFLMKVCDTLADDDF